MTELDAKSMLDFHNVLVFRSGNDSSCVLPFNSDACCQYFGSQHIYFFWRRNKMCTFREDDSKCFRLEQIIPWAQSSTPEKTNPLAHSNRL